MPRRKASEDGRMIVKQLPASENGHGALITTRSGQKYQISHCREKGRFTLWKICVDGLEKMSAADKPQELYQLIDMQS